MPPPSSKPTPSKQPRKVHPLLWFLGLVGAGILARVIVQWNIPVPSCGFRTLTTWPCPLCGGTRSLRAISDGDAIGAITLNPLVFLSAIAIAGWIVVISIDRVGKTNLSQRIRTLSDRLPLFWIATILILSNWGYLIFSLR